MMNTDTKRVLWLFVVAILILVVASLWSTCNAQMVFPGVWTTTGAPPGEAPTVVQDSGVNINNTSGLTIATSADVTSGNRIFVGFARYSPSGQETSLGDLTTTGSTATFGSWTLDVADTLVMASDIHLECGIYSAQITGNGTFVAQLAIDPGYSIWGSISTVEVNGLTPTQDAVAETAATEAGTSLSLPTFSTTDACFVYAVMQDDAGSNTSLTEDGDYTLIVEYEDGSNGVQASHVWRSSASALTNEVITWTVPSALRILGVVVAYK